MVSHTVMRITEQFVCFSRNVRCFSRKICFSGEQKKKTLSEEKLVREKAKKNYLIGDRRV